MWAMPSVSHFGINWAALSYASSLLLRLSIWATVLYVGLMTVLDAVEIWRMRSGSTSSLMTLLDLRIRNTKVKRLVNRWLPRLALFVVGYVLGQSSIFSSVRELHNVEVLSKDGDRVYTVKFENEATPITIRLCADGDDLPLSPGMVIDPFQYIQKKDCLLINSDTYVDWKRDGRRNVVDKNGRIMFAKEN